MRADFHVLIDACVLANQPVCDLFLRLAEGPRLYVPHWSEEILGEVRSTHEGLGWPSGVADYWQEKVRETFPEAMVEGYAPLIEQLENDPKDRHILAAAIKSHSEVIITFNLRHFPADKLGPWDIAAVSPDDYLITLYDMEAGVVVSKINDIAIQRKKRPEGILANLSRFVPNFAFHAAADLGWDLDEE